MEILLNGLDLPLMSVLNAALNVWNSFISKCRRGMGLIDHREETPNAVRGHKFGHELSERRTSDSFRSQTCTHITEIINYILAHCLFVNCNEYNHIKSPFTKQIASSLAHADHSHTQIRINYKHQ
eukprot:1009851_1